MNREFTHSYEDWLLHVFDHPTGERDWYWADDAGIWDGNRATTAEHLGRLFLESGQLPKRFSDKQISVGLNYVVNNCCSDHFCTLLDGKLPWEARKSGLAAIYNVFRDLFAVRCNDRLGHIDEPNSDELNGICYMWWDILPVDGEPDNPASKERDALLLRVMSDTLALNSEVCRESALHGLGHWQDAYPDQVEKIIHGFIWKDRKIRDSLRNYAYAAMHGDVQ